METPLENLGAIEADEQEQPAEEDRHPHIELEENGEDHRALLRALEVFDGEGGERPDRDDQQRREGEEVDRQRAG